MPKPVNFAVVGLGMCQHHCKAIARARGARLVAVCDTDEERLLPVAKEYACKAYTSYAAMLKDPEIDVVSVVTESACHATMGIQAARAGKHLVMEKPVDITPGRIQRLERAVAAAGVKCACIFQSRMDACNIAIKQAVNAGKLGKLIGLHGSLPWYRGPDYFAGIHGTWRATWAIDGGGSLMNQGIHTLDLLIFFGGAVESVCGFHDVHNHNIEAEDQAVGCLRYANGALGTLFTTTCCVPEGPQVIYGYGSKGSFRTVANRLDLYAMGSEKDRARMLERFGRDAAATDDAIARDPMAVGTDGHLMIIEDLVRAIRENRAPVIPLSTARHAVEVVCALYKSGRTGKAVRVATDGR
ncbi:MAG TPA: Gfo/Idh/MocA family oxidoreductase [Candidatus Hydrogenedentes bacterium]|nr:Gfo/Idh/MocA family oxidoreductase [Candidatus Hydrogenedentota bacterium]